MPNLYGPGGGSGLQPASNLSDLTDLDAASAVLRGKLPRGVVHTPEQHGAMGDGIMVTDLAIQAGSGTATSASFTAAATGKAIYVTGAGVSTSYGTLSGTLSTGGAITSIPVNSLAGPVPTGVFTVASGTHYQVFNTAFGANAGATSIVVDSVTPNFAYPSGTTIRTLGNGLSTTISTAGAGTATLAANATSTVSGVRAWWGTNDTAAIQAAVDAVFNAGGGRVLFDGKLYVMSSTPRTDRSGNSQVCLLSSLGNPPKVQLDGVPHVTMLMSTYVGGTYDAIHGPPSCFGGVTVESGIAGFGPEIRVEGIDMWVPENPTLGGWDFSGEVSMVMRHCTVNTPIGDTGSYGRPGRAPANTWAAGVLTPVGSNGTVRLVDVGVGGFYLGVCSGDHLICDHVELLPNYAGFGFYENHCDGYPATVLYMDIAGFAYAVTGWNPSTGVQALSAKNAWMKGYISFEDWTGWATPIKHFNDTGDKIIGKVDTHQRTFSGNPTAPIIDGGANLQVRPIDPRGETDVVTLGSPAFTRVFTSNGTWTKPPGVTKVKIDVIGGGGGGQAGYTAAASAVSRGGAGGGGGGWSSGLFSAADLTATVAVTVGAGTTGGVGSSGSNTTGASATKAAGASSFGAYVATTAAIGGGNTSAGSSPGTGGTGGLGNCGSGGAGATSDVAGGGGPNSTTSGGAGGGGAGGGITTGNAANNGGGGGAGSANASAAGQANGGAGGSTPNANLAIPGGGGAGALANTGVNGGAGGAGGNYGGGGGGGGSTQNGHTAGSGGNGANGIVVVTCW